MRLFRRPRKTAPAPPQQRESARALAQSQEQLRTEREQLVIPFSRLLEQNNVTPLVKELIRRKGAQGGHGTAPG